jgi:tRNA(Arg) A34 adenosine deaminase TadA
MSITLPLDKMTVEEMIQAMETIWDDLCERANNLSSPAWHAEILTEREAAIERGEDEFIDWETASVFSRIYSKDCGSNMKNNT